MATALSIIKRALRLTGELATGATPETSIQTESLEALNAMIESWQNEKLTIYDVREDSVTLTPSTASYTIGSGGSINIPRPVHIESAFIRASSLDYILKQISDTEYSKITQKTSTSDIPEYFSYTASYSTGTIKLWPTPSAANALYVRSFRIIAGFATTGDSVTLPPGYEDALAYNLAVRMSPEIGKPVTQELMLLARETKEVIKRTNNENRPMMADMPLLNLVGKLARSDIYTDM